MSLNPKIKLTLAVMFLAVSAERTIAQSAKHPLSEAERYVLKQVAAGETADLEEEFKQSEADRVLRASFLEDLMMNQKSAFKIHRMGIQITGARIPGTINLANTEIPYFVVLTKCHFDGVYFFQTVFRKGLTIDGATFDGAADFGFATVMEGLSADNSRFVNEKEPANFDTLKVTGPVSFEGATFAGPVNFVYAVIDGAFSIKKATFLSKEQEVSFNTMRIDSGFFAESATFEGPVDLVNLRVADNFEGRNCTFKNAATFEMMSLGHNLFLKDATFLGPVSFRSVNVTGNAELNDTKFQSDQPTQFLDMKASAVLIDKTQFRKAPDFTNLTYQNVYPTAGLLALLKESNPGYSAYTELEKCLQRNGYSSEADEVFMEMKVYERRKGLTLYNSMKSYVSQALQGFGRKTERVFYYDLGIVLLGTFLFRRLRMVLKSESSRNQSESKTGTKTNPTAEGATNNEEGKPESTANTPPYNAFLFSLTLFAPAIDTQYTNNWEPDAKHKRIRLYMRLQKVVGYLLVPLTIAIWSGVFK